MLATALAVPVDLPRAEVFDFIANEANLPTWLPAIQTFETSWVDADSQTGVVDVWLRSAGTRDGARLPIRILDTEPGACVVLVSCIGGCDGREVEFAQAAAVLGRDLVALPELVGAGLLRS